MGYRRGRCPRRHARGAASSRSANDALAAAQDACRSARSARREAVRHQIRRRLPHPSRPRRQHDAVSAKHAAGAEGGGRMALAAGSPLQTGPAGDQARARAPVTQLWRERVVCGGGGVMTNPTPARARGRQSLLVNLVNSAAVLHSRDAVHFKANWESRRVPENNGSKDKTVASKERMADVM